MSMTKNKLQKILLLTCMIVVIMQVPVYAMQTDEQILENVRSKRILWSKPYPEKEINHKELRNANDSYIGWLSFHFDVEDDRYNIDLEEPVPFETETDYYLHHDFYKNPDKNGCVFMDYDSNSTLYGYNDFLYAHHAEDGTLFGTLNRIYEYGDKTHLKEHPQYMYIYTDTACHKYVLTGYERVDDSNDHYAYTTCENEEIYHEYVEYLKSLPDFIDSDEIQWDCNPPVLNFSTCDGPAGTSKRFVVHFVKIASYSIK